MISLDRASYQVQPRYAEYAGLSTDVKPVEVDNGDEFQEINTGFVYKFDETGSEWVKQPTGGGGTGGGGGAEVWEDIGTVPLSSDVSLYELSGVDDFRKIRLIILREYNAELTGSMSARILTSKGVLSAILGNFSGRGRAMCNVSVGVDNLGVTGGEVYSVNNLLNTAAPAKFISKGPGFGGSANYNRLDGDKYVLYAQRPETCFDGKEVARLQGVRR